MTEQQPVLPAAAWYTSEVQVRAVIAAAAQLVSIALRIIGKYTDLEITTEMIDSIVADVTQGVAVIFGVLAVTKRQTSAVAPLTMTAKQAEDLTRINPPLLDSNPTKLPKETK